MIVATVIYKLVSPKSKLISPAVSIFAAPENISKSNGTAMAESVVKKYIVVSFFPFSKLLETQIKTIRYI